MLSTVASIKSTSDNSQNATRGLSLTVIDIDALKGYVKHKVQFA